MFKGFANLRQSLTTNVFLRRISRELHRANELAETRLMFEHPAAYKAYKSGRGKVARVSEISVASVEAWNTEWAKMHPNMDED